MEIERKFLLVKLPDWVDDYILERSVVDQIGRAHV